VILVDTHVWLWFHGDPTLTLMTADDVVLRYPGAFFDARS
jgi:hypothetical protein